MRGLNFLRFFFVGIFLLNSCVHSQMSIEPDKTKKPDFTWRFNDLKKQLDENNGFSLLSPVFPLKAYPLSAQARLTLKGDNSVVVDLSFKDIHKSRKFLDLPVLPSLYYVLNDPKNRHTVRYECYFMKNHASAYDTSDFEVWLSPLYQIAVGNFSVDIFVQSPPEGQPGAMVCVNDDFRQKEVKVKKPLIDERRKKLH